MEREEVISIYYTEKEGRPDILYLLRRIVLYSLRTNEIFYDVRWILSVLDTWYSRTHITYISRGVRIILLTGRWKRIWYVGVFRHWAAHVLPWTVRKYSQIFWLRHYATSWMVAGSSPDEVIQFVSIYLIFPILLDPEVYSASNMNE
jgi:hypothetical protein